MDEHYQAVYDRCRAALAKLEKRKIEVEKLNKDLAQTADNLKSANSALIVSENVFVRLRAQAFYLQTKCSTFYGDLDVLHDRIGAMKQMFVQSDHLVGEFANDHIERLKRQQSVLNQYTDESVRRMEKSEAMAVEIDKQTGCSSMELIQTFAGMGKEMEDFKSAADNTLATLRADVEKAQSRLQSFVGACQDRMQQQIAIISKHTELVQEGTRAIEHAGGEQRTMTMYMRDKLSTAFSESQAATEQFLHPQDYRRFQDTGTTPERRQTSNLSGLLLSLSALSGTFASVLGGLLVDRTKRFNEFIKAAYLGIALTAAGLNLFLRHRRESVLDTVVLSVLLTLLGAFAVPVFPISLELGVESTFPVAEATSSGILIIAGQLQLFLLTLGMQFVEQQQWIYTGATAGRANYQLSVDLWTVCALFAALFSCAFLWPKYHRLEYEQNAIFLHLLPPTFGDISGGNSATTNGMLLFPFAAATTAKCDKKDDNKAEEKNKNNL